MSVKNWRIVAVLFSFKLTITLVVESTWICFTLQILSEWKNSNVKSSLLVNCSVKLVKKKKMVSFSCFYPFECLLFKKTPLLLKDFQLFHLGLCLISHTLEKREIWRFYEETLKSYPRIFFIFHYKYFKFESTKTCKPVMSRE